MQETLKIPGMAIWWLIPLSKWVITPVIDGISRVNPLVSGVITHLQLSLFQGCIRLHHGTGSLI